MAQLIVSTATEMPGTKVVEHLGLVRGIAVRSINFFQFMWLFFRLPFGGRIGALRKVSDRVRQEALEDMLEHAHSLGADAVIGVRYDSSAIYMGMTEVLVYGTAVKLRKDSS